MVARGCSCSTTDARRQLAGFEWCQQLQEAVQRLTPWPRLGCAVRACNSDQRRGACDARHHAPRSAQMRSCMAWPMAWESVMRMHTCQCWHQCWHQWQLSLPAPMTMAVAVSHILMGARLQVEVSWQSLQERQTGTLQTEWRTCAYRAPAATQDACASSCSGTAAPAARSTCPCSWIAILTNLLPVTNHQQ